MNYRARREYFAWRHTKYTYWLWTNL